MFRKPPVRTYERKNAGANPSSILLSKMVRDLPPDRNMQPTEIEASQDADDSMDDPFDTTFDRLLKTAKMPPRPVIQESNGYDSSSSSDVKSNHSDDDLPIPLPLVYDEPVEIQRRVFGWKTVVVDGGLTKKSYKRRVKPAKKSNVSDENADPNTEQIPVGNKRGKTKAAASKEEGPKKKQVTKKRTSIEEYRRRKKNLSTSHTDDSTNNTTQRSEVSSIVVLSSTTEENSNRLITEKNTSTYKQGKQGNDSKSRADFSDDSTQWYEDLAVPGPSNASDNYVKQFVTKQKTSTHREEIQKKANERQIDVFDNSIQQYEDFAIPGPSNASDDYINQYITKRKKSTQQEEIQKNKYESQTKNPANPAEQHEDFAIPGTNARVDNKKRISKEQEKTSEETAKIPKIIIDKVSTPIVENNPRTLQNLTVSLTRLNIPHRFSIANQSWKNSTPITQRPKKPKSVLRFSPIDKNESANLRVRLGDENSGEASLPSKSLAPTADELSAESKNMESPQKSSENLEEQSIKRPRIILSDSPAPDPSALLFEDTEVQEEPSSTSSETHAKTSDTTAPRDEKSECKNTTEASTISAFKGFSASTQADHFDAIASLDEKFECKNTTEPSTTSLFKGFSMESSDAESLHLQLEGTDDTQSSPENLKQTENATSKSSRIQKKSQASANEENDGDTMEASTVADVTDLTRDSSDAESIRLTFNEDEDEESAPSSKVPLDTLGDENDASVDEQSTGLPEDSHDYTADALEKIESDDDWSTIASFQEIDDVIPKKREVRLKISSKITEPKRRESIEQLSSGDTSTDDISELIQANEISSTATEEDFEEEEEERLDDQESAVVEDINGNESKAMELSVSETRYEKDARQDLLQPIVLLERLILPLKQSEKTENLKNKRGRKTSMTLGSRGKSNDNKISEVDTMSRNRKSRRLTDLKRGWKNIVDSSVSSDEVSVSKTKSRRLTNAEKIGSTVTKATQVVKDLTLNPAKQKQNSVLSSSNNDNTFKEAIPVRKSKRITKAGKKSVNQRKTLLASQDSPLSSPNRVVSGSKSRESRKLTKVKEVTIENHPEKMEMIQDSWPNSSDDDSAFPSRKSNEITNLSYSPASHDSSMVHSAVYKGSIDGKSVSPENSRKTGEKYPSDTLQSTANSTLSSIENSPVERVSVNKKSVSPKKSTKTGVKYPLEPLETSSLSKLNSGDARLSPSVTPDPPKKIRKLTQIDPLSSNNSLGSPGSSKNTTMNFDDNSIFLLETPIVRRKSRRLSDKSKASPKNLFETTPSSQNSTINSGDDSINNDPSQDSSLLNVEIKNHTDNIHDAVTPIIRRKSRRVVSSDEAEASDSSKTLKSKVNPQSKVDVKNTTKNKKSQDDIESLAVEENDEVIDPREAYLRRSKQPVVLLNRLNDPVRVSLRRRNKFSNLSVITENIGRKTTAIIEEDSEEPETSQNGLLTQSIVDRPETLTDPIEIASQQTTTASCGSSIFSNPCNRSRFEDKEDKLLFLKPGKSWTRSLSILSNVHSQEDLESLAVGKGKKWRESVNAILQMQQQGLLQSCVKKNENDKESRSVYGVRSSTTAWTSESSQSDTSRVFGTASPGRFVRRVSIRVVPNGKNLDNNEDASFLEAYGITASQNRQTIGKRSTSLAARKTFVYNLQDVSYDNIPKSIDSGKSRDVVLQQCCQETHLPFDECYPPSYLKYCRKIGEGVYGEVFLYEKGTEKTVIKIIPIEGKMDVNNERQKKFDEILSEIVIAKELHNLRFAESSRTHSFVEVKNIRCVIGKYPQKLIELWNTYDEEKNSENDCPAMFDTDQLYIVLELGHGGEDLEAFHFQNASESLALFMQTAVALAVAEEKLEFEHRDLHWGNILIARTDESHVEFKLQNKSMKLASRGVKVSVIDFTLSRMTYTGCNIFNDLSEDDDLFTAQGEYQFEIYRLMREKVENDWRRFEPFTNVLWLHYTLDKMIRGARYRRENSKIHTTSIKKLQELKDTILNYTSALDFVTNCDKVTLLQSRRASVTTVT